MEKNYTKIKKLLRYIGNTYKEIGTYLKANKWLILLIFLFLIEIVVFYVLNTSADDHYYEYVEDTEYKYPNMFLFIFIENLKTFTAVLLYGVIPLFLGSLFSAMMTVSGLITTFKYIIGFIPTQIILLGTVPHGLVEIPCLIACIILGCLVSKELTLTILKAVRKKELVLLGKTHETIGLTKTVSFVYKSWLFVVMPMTLTAALIENFITPLIMKAAV